MIVGGALSIDHLVSSRSWHTAARQDALTEAPSLPNGSKYCIHRAGHTKWTRERNYRMPLNKLASMGASYADNTEIQTVHYASREAWTLSIAAVTPNVPMGNLFRTVLYLTANNEVTSSPPRCRLCVYGDVVFHKHQPLKEALVRRPVLNGVRSTYVLMLHRLQEQLQLCEKEDVVSEKLLVSPFTCHSVLFQTITGESP
jgi:VAD1 Analog of StAR-related lipid transfer domain